MLSYAAFFTVTISFINFDKHLFDSCTCMLYRLTWLAPEKIKKSISGPRTKKVVHHWFMSKPAAYVRGGMSFFTALQSVA